MLLYSNIIFILQQQFSEHELFKTNSIIIPVLIKYIKVK